MNQAVKEAVLAKDCAAKRCDWDWEVVRYQENADVLRLRAQQAQIEAEIANIQLRSYQQRLRIGMDGAALFAPPPKNELGPAAASLKPAVRKTKVVDKAVPTEPGAKPKRVMTPEGRKRIADAQKKRWAEKRKEGTN